MSAIRTGLLLVFCVNCITLSVGNYINLDFAMRNIIKNEGEIVRIRCEISGRPLPQYSWYKNGIPIDKGNARISIRTTLWGSRLKIKNVDLSDSGSYTCKASNAAGEVNTTGTLRVISDSPEVSNTDIGREEERKTPEDVGEVPFRSEDGLSKETRVGFCQDFRGSTCARFLQNTSIYVESEYSQGIKEERFIAGITTLAASYVMSSECQRYAMNFLCHYTFQPCDVTSAEPRPIKMCRDECEMLKQNICREEYGVGMDSPLLGGDFMPQCNLLPPMDTEEGSKCFRIGVPAVRTDANY